MAGSKNMMAGTFGKQLVADIGHKPESKEERHH